MLVHYSKRTVIFSFLLGLFLVALSFLPVVVGAEPGGSDATRGYISSIIPCGRVGQPECSFCYLGSLVQNVINFLLIYVAGPITALFFAYAGFLYMAYGVNPNNIEKAREIFKSTAIGFFWMLAAWLVVDTVINMLGYNPQYGPWNRIVCVDPASVIRPPVSTNPSVQIGGNGTTPTRVSGSAVDRALAASTQMREAALAAGVSPDTLLPFMAATCIRESACQADIGCSTTRIYGDSAATAQIGGCGPMQMLAQTACGQMGLPNCSSQGGNDAVRQMLNTNPALAYQLSARMLGQGVSLAQRAGLDPNTPEGARYVAAYYYMPASTNPSSSCGSGVRVYDCQSDLVARGWGRFNITQYTYNYASTVMQVRPRLTGTALAPGFEKVFSNLWGSFSKVYQSKS